MKFHNAGSEWLEIQGILIEEECDPFHAQLKELAGDARGVLDQQVDVDIDRLLTPYEEQAFARGYQLAKRGVALDDVLQLGQLVRNQLLRDLFEPSTDGPQDLDLQRLLHASALISRYTNQFVLGYHERQQEEFVQRSAHQRIESYGEGGLTLNEKDLIPLVNDQGETSSVLVVTYTSVSEKERLYNMQKQFSFVLDSMNSGLLILNSECCVAGFNQKAQEIFGLEPEKVIGTTLADLYTTNVLSDDDGLLGKLQTLVAEGRPLHGIHKTIHMGDRTLSLRLDGNPILNAGGVSVGYIMIVEDMTELQAMREAMMRNEKFALIGQFAAGIAHEIRNPLTTVFGFLQLLAAGSVKHENFADLTRTLLIPELDRANIILSDFLMVSKPTAPQRSAVDTGQFFEDVVRLIESEAHLRGVMLQIDTVGSLPSLNLDVQQMKQVFLNLCKNAFDVTPPGGCLRLTAKPQVQSAHVRFDVIDEGPGIQADHLSKIFDPFYTTKEQGTGLGLSISHRIVEGHSGKLKVRSAAGVGTTFTILIPIGE